MIAHAIDSSRVIRCVVYPSTVIVSPGVIEHIEGNRFSIGELDRTSSERCKRLAASLITAGLRAPIRGHIRHDMWIKLLGNVVFNPMSALTGASLVEMATHPEPRDIVRAVMAEVDAVAEGLGVRLPLTIDQRMDGARKVGAHRTSVLQDLEAGRPMELESVVGVVIELGEKVGLPMPHTRTLDSCARLLDQIRTQ